MAVRLSREGISFTLRWRQLAQLALGSLVLGAVVLMGSRQGQRAIATLPPTAAGRIAFETNRDGNREIYIMNADGTGQTNLTMNAAQDIEPAWSPDGTKIAFASDRSGDYEIYVMNEFGSAPPVRLTFAAGVDVDPAWSPDGREIAFTSTRDGNPEIYTMNADGSGQTNRTNHPRSDSQASYGPKGGHHEVFWTSDRDGNFDIYHDLISPYGFTDSTQSDASNETNSYAWTSGTGAYFVTDVEGDLNVAGRDFNGLSFTSCPCTTANDQMPATDPSVINFGNYAFVSNQDGDNEIYTRAGIRLTNNTADDGNPDWQPFHWDVNRDGTVNVADITAVVRHFGQSGVQDIH
jgi:Tol biopolymer transport system component